MPDIDVRIPDGRLIRIRGAESDDAARAAVQSMLQQERRDAPRTGSSLASGIDSYQASLFSALEGLGRGTNQNWLERMGREGRIRNEQEAEQSLPQAQRQSFEDVETPGDAARATLQALGQTAAPSAVGMGGAAAGAALGSLVAPGIGTAAGALLGGTIANYPTVFGSNRQRQIQENPNQPVNEGAAAAAAVPQAALESVSDVVLGRLGRVFGMGAEEVGRRIIPRIMRGIGLGAVSEAPPEVLQQALERAQAGLDLFSPEAMREYRESGIGALAVGGVMGGGVAGVAGARPQVATQIPEEAPQQQGGTQAPAPADPGILPAQPAPIEDAGLARQFLASDPAYAPRFEVSDDEAITLANRFQNLAHEQETNSLRRNEVSRYLGVPAVREVDGTAARDVQADQLLQRLVGAAADPNTNLDIGNFNIYDVASLALSRLGPEAAAPTRQELSMVRQQLNALRDAGFLMNGAERGNFAVAPKPIEQLRQRAAERQAANQRPTRADRREVSDQAAEYPGLAELATEAPPTQQQSAAQIALVIIADPRFAQATPEERQKIVAALDRQDSAAANALAEYTSALERHTEVARQVASNPALAATPEVQALDQELAQLRAAAVDKLTGQQNISAIVAPNTNPVVTDAPTRGPGGFPGDINPSNVNEILTAARNLQSAAQLNTLMSNPAYADTVLRALTQNLPPRAGMTWNRWQQLFRENNVPFTPEQGRLVYETARERGLVNSLGNLIWRPQDQSREALMTPPTQEQTAAPAPAAAPAPPTRVNPWVAAQEEMAGYESPAFMEPDGSEGDAVLGDDRATDEPNFMRQAEAADRQLPGLIVDPDGSFHYYYDIGQGDGAVSISGTVGDRVMQVSVAQATRNMRGKGHGLKAYENLIRWAHANGLEFQSDSQVSEAAGRVYEALARRGYDVNVLPAAFRYRSGDSWVADNLDEPIYSIPAPANFARQAPGPQTSLDMEAAREAGQRAFQRVLGANGRLEIRDQIFLRDLGQRIEEAARAMGITVDTVDGYASGDLAILALRDTTTPIADVAIHEGYHVAERIGIFTPQEIHLLNANLDKIRNLVQQQIPNVAAEYLANPAEVRAYGLNARVAQNADFGPLINRIYDKFTNFVERIKNFVTGQGFQTWRDVYDAFNSGGMAGRAPDPQQAVAPQLRNRATAAPNFLVPRLPANTAQAHAIVKQQTDQITGIFKWFSSPMLMGRTKPALAAASDTMRQLYTRTQEATSEFEMLMAAVAHLDAPARARVTRAWEQASRSKKAPNYAAMAPNEAEALRNSIAGGQRALDYMIAAYTNEYFQPNADKSPAERARLEAFWAKHADKNLWEIPAREVAAASPEGWREMQRFERMRNPYYMPMMARGSHFVAAYEIKPGGKEKLVRMVAYNPLNILQKYRGFADPQAAAIAELKRQFPNASRYRITQDGTQFSNDAQAQKVRDQGDFVAQYLNELYQVSSSQGQKIIGHLQNQIDKAQMERLFRPNQDILQAITPANESSYILDAIPQYMLSTAKIQSRRYTQDNWKRALAGLTANDQAFLNDLRDYATTPTEAFGTARALSFFMYLGGALDTAAINMTQLGQTTLPMLTRDGGASASVHFLSAARDTFGSGDLAKALSGDLSFTQSVLTKALKSPDEAAAVMKAMKQGVFTPIFANESRGQFTSETMNRLGVKNGASVAASANKITHFFGSFMQAIEEVNRLTTFLAAHRMATANPEVIAYANRADSTNWTNAYDYAMGKVFDSQFLTTKEDRAYIQRFTPAAEVITQFGSFPLKMTELFVRAGGQLLQGIAKRDPFMAKAGGVLLLAMAAPVIGAAGIWGLPGADKTRDLLEFIVGKLYGSTQNFDADAREFLGGGRFAEAVLRGVPHAYDWLSLNRRLAIDPLPVQDLTGNITGLMGPTGGLVDAWLNRMPQYVSNGDYWNAAAVLMPRSVGNIVRGAQIAVTGEQRTLRGNRVVTPEDVARVDSYSWVPASVRQALGFPPPEFGNMREMVAMGEEVSRRTRDASERVNKELAGYLTHAMEARRDGDSTRAASLLNQYGTRFREIIHEQDSRPIDRRLTLNQGSISQRAVRDFYGISSQEVLGRNAPRNVRPEIARQRELLDWRNQSR